MNNLRNAIAASIWLLLALSPAPSYAEPGDRLQQLRAIPLRLGSNLIEDFASDGRAAMIILGWRDNGNAHGYDLFLTMMPTSPGGADWNVVGVESRDGLLDTVRDAPHVGEDMTRSVRFAKGLFDGRRATLLLISTREPGESIPAPSRVFIEVFSLRANTDGSGNTHDYFEPVLSFRTNVPYCHAEMALQTELGLPVRRGYEGRASADGC